MIDVYIKITYMGMYLQKNQKKIITKIDDLNLLYIFLKTNNKIKKELCKNTLSQFLLIYKYKFIEL